MKYARSYRPKHKKGQMNGTEKAYGDHLELLKIAGDIESYSFEVTKLKIGDDCWYIPDYRVVRPITKVISGEILIDYISPSECKLQKDYIIEFHEVKGTTRSKNPHPIGSLESLNFKRKNKPYIEDDALVKIKAAAELHPYKFIIVWLDQGKWMTREMN